MRKGRIGLALSACAAVGMSLTGSPHASADVLSMSVYASGWSHEEGPTPWSISVVISCDPAGTPVAPPVYFTDNGRALYGSPVAATTGDSLRMFRRPPYCDNPGGGYQSFAQITYMPRTLGAHHIVATQYKPDGSVLSTMAQDVNVTESPCTVIGSVAYPIPCN